MTAFSSTEYSLGVGVFASKPVAMAIRGNLNENLLSKFIELTYYVRYLCLVCSTPNRI